MQSSDNSALIWTTAYSWQATLNRSSVQLPYGCYGCAITIGHSVFLNGPRLRTTDPLLWHEYIHVLQQEGGGYLKLVKYTWYGVGQFLNGQEIAGPGNANEALGYLWQGWGQEFQQFGEKPSWCFFKPTSGTTLGC
jgi:hypothetical protein